MALLRDAQYGVRAMARAPWTTAVAVLSLAIGIAGNSVIFSAADALGMRPLRIANPTELIRIEMKNEEDEGAALSYDELRALRERAHTLAVVAGYEKRGVAVSGNNHAPEITLLSVVTANYLPALGIHPAMGRAFLAEEDTGGGSVAMISHRFWQRWFEADPSIVGKPVILNRSPFTVVGVLPADFTGVEPQIAPDIWVTRAGWTALLPAGLTATQPRRDRALSALAYARPGVTLEQVRAELASLSRQLAAEHPATNGHLMFTAVYDVQERVDRLSTLRLILLGIVGLVLLIACANVAGLLLGRAEARRHEIGVRLALGASRGRLVVQMLTESAVLSAAAGVVALLLAYWLLRAIPALIPSIGIPLGFEFRLDRRVFLYTVAVTLLTAPVFGLLPALLGTRAGVATIIKGANVGARRGVAGIATRNLVVVSQIALSVVLLMAAGLFLRSFLSTSKISPGFEQRPMVFLSTAPVVAGYSDRQSDDFFRRLVEKATNIPGVEQVTMARRVPLSVSGGGAAMPVQIPGQERAPGAAPLSIRFNVVAPTYFATMGTRLLRGRPFSPSDTATSTPVVLISQTMSRKYWANEDPIGRHVKIGPAGTDREIVGIVQDAKNNSLQEKPEPYFYLPLSQQSSPERTVIVRVAGNPQSFVGPLRRVMQETDRSVPILQLLTVEQHMSFAMFLERMQAMLVTILGGIGLLLSMTGLYAVVAFLVARRTREVGIRMALGASPRYVQRQVIGQALLFAAFGVGLGVAGGIAVGRVLSGMLYGVGTIDGPTVAGVIVAVPLTTVLASYVPARRASRIDPMLALRQE